VIYVARKKFTGNGVDYLPGDIVPDVDSWPRPESVVRAGYVVLQDDQTPTAPVEIKPVRATRKPKE
jgi:hypothetical protein